MAIFSSLGADYEDQSPKCEFLCDLEEKTSTRIILVGEYHDSPLGNKVRAHLNRLACRGEAYLAVEGLIAGKKSGIRLEASCGKGKTKNALIYGLENELSYTFVGAYHGYRYLVYDLKYNHDLVREKKITFIIAIGNTSISKDAWKRVSKDNEHRFPEFIALLNEYVNQCEKATDVPMDFIKQLMGNNNFMGNDRAFVELSKAFAREVGIKVQEYLELSDKEFSNFSDFLEDPINSDITNLTVGYRDKIMAQNLAKLYCKAQPTGKLVYAIVGKGHIEGVKEYLSHASGGKIDVEEMDLTKE